MIQRLPACHPPELREWAGVGEEEGREPERAHMLALDEPTVSEGLAFWGDSANVTALADLRALALVDGRAASAHRGAPEAIRQLAVRHPEGQGLADLTLKRTTLLLRIHAKTP